MAGCEEMAEKISAWIDGELEADEVPSLIEHLSECRDCRILKERYQAIDRIAQRSSIRPGPFLQRRIEKALEPKRPKARLKTFVGIAASVLILITLALAILLTSDTVDIDLLVGRVAAMEAINNQAIKDQDSVLKTLEWDLDAMKLEVGCMELDEKSTNQLLKRIDDLQREIERMRLKDKIQSGREKPQEKGE